MSEQFDIEARWPALFEGLDSRTKRAVVRSLAAGWHEGWKINYADVHDLVEFAQGSIDLGEYEQRARQAAEQAAMKGKLTHRKRAQLVRSDTSPDDLREIAEGLGWLNPAERACAAEQLIAHPNFTPEAFNKAITNVNAIGFFEDPTEHNTTVAALETARAAAVYSALPERAEPGELRTTPGTERCDEEPTSSMFLPSDSGRVGTATEMQELASVLAASTESFSPAEAGTLMAQFGATVGHLARVAEHLEEWHQQVVADVHFRGDGAGAYEASHALNEVAQLLREASDKAERARYHSEKVRWNPDSQHSIESSDDTQVSTRRQS